MAESKKSNVAEIRNLNSERNDELVSVLEEWVKLAKEGHFSDVAFIGKVRGAPMTEFHWDGDNPLELVGSLELAKLEVSSEMLAEAHDEDEEEDE